MTGFGTALAAKLTGVNPKTLHYWDGSGFISPSVAQSRGTGTRRCYSFRDLIAVRVARELRNAGISLQALRRVAKYLRDHEEVEQPLAGTYLVTDGKDVYVQNGENLVSALREPGQGLLFHVVDLARAVGELRDSVLKVEAAKGDEARTSCRAG